MQNKHDKNRRKKLSMFCLFIFSIVKDSVFAKLSTLINYMNLSHSADSVVFYQAKLKPACPATGAN